ncbi:hypothetical protein V6N13_051984 [Hibiscus sabdariffa]
MEDQGLVFLLDPESEPSLLLRQWSPSKSLGLPLNHDMLPQHGGAAERIEDTVIVGETERSGGRVESTSEAQAVAIVGNEGTEIELDGVVEFVGADAVDLGDVEVAVGREEMEETVEESETEEAELRWENQLEEALAKGQNPKQ